jgi:hypothetical protein
MRACRINLLLVTERYRLKREKRLPLRVSGLFIRRSLTWFQETSGSERV